MSCQLKVVAWSISQTWVKGAGRSTQVLDWKSHLQAYGLWTTSQGIKPTQRVVASDQ